MNGTSGPENGGDPNESFLTSVESHVKTLFNSIKQDTLFKTNATGTQDDILKKVDRETDESVDSVFSMIRTMMNDMNKYTEKPYLATSVMLKYFESMASLGDVPLEAFEDVDLRYSEAVKKVATYAKQVCEMLNGKTIEELCPSPEFKECILNISIGYDDMLIWTFKMGIKQLKKRRPELTDDVSTETLLNGIYNTMSKTKK